MRIRRFVTGRNGKGESIFALKGEVPNRHEFVHIPGMAITQVWATDKDQVIPVLPGDVTAQVRNIVPKPGETKFMVVTFPPDRTMGMPGFDPATAGAEMLQNAPGLAETFEIDNPGMHTTETVDYGIVLQGVLTLELDGGELEHLRPGDVVIQNGTRHAWRNVTEEPAVIAFVLTGARRSA